MSLSAAQIENRRKTIGGSDIGAILGENNYKTAYEVWEEKVEGKSVDLSKNKSVIIGNLLESFLIDKYESISESFCVNTKDATFYHPRYEFLSANLDAYCVKDNLKKILEVKTASVFNKDEWGPSGSQIVPRHYYAQIAHYMLVTGYKEADIFVGFVDESIKDKILCEFNLFYERANDGFMIPLDFSEIVNEMEVRTYTFYKDEELESLILNAANDFYNLHMAPWIEHGTKCAPSMDFSNKGFQNCIRKKYSINDNSEIKLPEIFTTIKDKYLSAISQSNFFEKLANEEKAKILAAMENNEKAVLSDGSYFFRKKVKRKEYTVKESEYIKFEFKKPNKTEGEF